MSVPVHDHAGRRDRIRATFASLGVESMVVTHRVDVRWLTGLDASNAQVVLRADGDDVLCTDDRYGEPARATGVPVVLAGWIGAVGPEGDVVLPGPAMAVQAEHVTMVQRARLSAEVPGLVIVATTGVLAQARRHKDAAELALLTEACAITSQGWDWLVEHVRVGQSEIEIARGLMRHLEDLGAEGPAFDPIVAGGPNSAVPHHHPTDRPVQVGDLLKVDFGAKVGGYHADCTRVLALGDPGTRLREIHAAVVEGQDRGVRATLAGVAAGDVHDASVGYLEGLDLGPTLHGVGHGVGLEIHETPILSSEPTATLESGFVVTVEPGIYLSGLGGVRIEDTVAVTDDGPRRLTTCGRDLVVC